MSAEQELIDAINSGVFDLQAIAARNPFNNDVRLLILAIEAFQDMYAQEARAHENTQEALYNANCRLKYGN